MNRGRLGIAALQIFMIAIPAIMTGGDLFAAKIPSWAKPFIEKAPPLPESAPENPSRVLLSEVREKVRPDGTVDIRYRLITQVLSVAGGDVSFGGFHFEETAKMGSSKAWHVRPGKRAKKSWETPLDLTLDDAFLSDSKVRMMHVDNVVKGSVVLFEFKAHEEPYFMPRVHYFHEGSDIKVARYQLVLPKEWKVEWRWARNQGPAPEIVENSWTWQIVDLALPPDEPLGKNVAEVIPLLALNLTPPDPGKVKPALFANWRDFSVWYEKLAGERHKATPKIVSTAKATMDSAGKDFFSQVRAAGNYVRDTVRYVDIELGIGGMQPRHASETFSNLYGDCKDKGTLFRSMLDTTNLLTYPVLVNLTVDRTVTEEIPGWGFNHFVVAVPVPAGLDVPDSFRHAIVDTDDLGRLLIVDTTSEGNTVGFMSGSLAGKQGLVIAGEKGRLVRMPGNVPEAHTVLRRIKTELTTNKALNVNRVTAYSGEFARRMRGYLRRSSSNFKENAERSVLSHWPESEFNGFELEVETAGGTFVEKIAFEQERLNAPGEAIKIRLFPGVSDELRRVPLRKRKELVDYGFPRTVTFESTLSGAPEDVGLPKSSEKSGEGWTLDTFYTREGDVIQATCRLELTRTEFPPDSFTELRSLWTALRRAESKVLLIP